MATSFPDVIDYFAMGVLVLIGLLAVAWLFPPPESLTRVVLSEGEHHNATAVLRDFLGNRYCIHSLRLHPHAEADKKAAKLKPGIKAERGEYSEVVDNAALSERSQRNVARLRSWFRAANYGARMAVWWEILSVLGPV